MLFVLLSFCYGLMDGAFFAGELSGANDVAWRFEPLRLIEELSQIKKTLGLVGSRTQRFFARYFVLEFYGPVTYALCMREVIPDPLLSNYLPIYP